MAPTVKFFRFLLAQVLVIFVPAGMQALALCGTLRPIWVTLASALQVLRVTTAFEKEKWITWMSVHSIPVRMVEVVYMT